MPQATTAPSQTGRFSVLLAQLTTGGHVGGLMAQATGGGSGVGA